MIVFNEYHVEDKKSGTKSRRLIQTPKELGGILRLLRNSKKLKQCEVSEQLGINRSTYSYYESGEITPTIFTLIKLSEIFGVELTTLFFVDLI